MADQTKDERDRDVALRIGEAAAALNDVIQEGWALGLDVKVKVAAHGRGDDALRQVEVQALRPLKMQEIPPSVKDDPRAAIRRALGEDVDPPVRAVR